MAALSASRLVCSKSLNDLDHLADLLGLGLELGHLRGGALEAARHAAVGLMLSANSVSPCSTLSLASRASSSAKAALWLTLSAVLASSVTAEATCSVSLRCCWALASDWVITAASSVAAEATLPLMPVRVWMVLLLGQGLVDVGGQLAQLVVAVGGGAHIEAALGHGAHHLLQLADGAHYPTGQPPATKQGGQQGCPISSRVRSRVVW